MYLRDWTVKFGVFDVARIDVSASKISLPQCTLLTPSLPARGAGPPFANYPFTLVRATRTSNSTSSHRTAILLEDLAVSCDGQPQKRVIRWQDEQTDNTIMSNASTQYDGALIKPKASITCTLGSLILTLTP